MGNLQKLLTVIGVVAASWVVNTYTPVDVSTTGVVLGLILAKVIE